MAAEEPGFQFSSDGGGGAGALIIDRAAEGGELVDAATHGGRESFISSTSEGSRQCRSDDELLEKSRKESRRLQELILIRGNSGEGSL